MLPFGAPSVTTPKIYCNSYSVPILTTVFLFTKHWSIVGSRYSFFQTTAIDRKIIDDSKISFFGSTS